MKKFIFLSVLCLLICSLRANAQKRIVKPSQAITLETGLCTVNYADNKGFVLMAGEGANQFVLGYADNGNLPSSLDEMPEGLQCLIRSYSNQLQQLAEAGKAPKKLPAHASIEPLVKSAWMQGEPLNMYCPDGSLLGCVAVVMGQLMKYHEYPQQGQGERNGYDFSARQWDWSLMLDSYAGDYTQAQAEEAAMLLRQCGASVDMEYGTYASSAVVSQMLQSLNQYWKYDDSMAELQKSNYTDEQWDSLMYNELTLGRPVAYSGRDSHDAGHAFILDGYKDGYYHINWGWNGSCDGYFAINNLVDSPTDYNFEQNAVVNVKPEDGIEAHGWLEKYGSDRWTVTPAAPAAGEDVVVSINFGNVGAKAFKGYVGITVKDMTDDTETVQLSNNIGELQSFYSTATQFTIPADKLTSQHGYKVNVWYKIEGTDEQLAMPTAQTNLTFKVGADGQDLELYPRKMVVEEGTGTWCGWCVRGIVAMETMKKNHPDQFVGIAVHSGDAMVAGDYDLGFTGYPGAKINRANESDVSPDIFENWFNAMDKTTNKMVKVNSVLYDPYKETFTVSTTARFGRAYQDADYRLVYVVTEDSVGPYMQSNYYAGGAYGEMGGYENMERAVSTIFNDVERGVYPSITGEAGSVPATIEACTDYEATCTFNKPEHVTTFSHLNMVALLYDALTGEIVNADKVSVMPIPETGTQIELTVDLGNNPGTLEELLADSIYNVKTLHLKGKINGDDLWTIRHMCGLGDSYASTITGNKTLKELDMKEADIVEGGYYVNGWDDTPVELEKDNFLPELVFACSPSLTKVTTPNSLKEIGNEVFRGCNVLEELELNEGLERLNNYVTEHIDMSGMPLKHLHLPSTLSYLNGTSLDGVFQLEDFSIAENNPFYVYDGQCIYNKDKSVLVSSQRGYKGPVTVADECRKIEWDAFDCNWNVTKLIAPYVIETEQGAFQNMVYASDIAFGPSLWKFGADAFRALWSYGKIYLSSPRVVEYTTTIIVDEGDPDPALTLYVPEDLIPQYQAHEYWGKFSQILPIEGTEYEYLKQLEDVSAGIETVSADSRSAFEKNIYTIDGRRLSAPQKGVNLINGRKYVIK